MTYQLGIDIGGTFTDFALFHRQTEKMTIRKRLTTPHDPSVAVIEGTKQLLLEEGVGIAEVESIVHGTTLVTNVVIERKGAATGMLVTAGFRDVVDIGLEKRYDLFDLRLVFPPPIIPRPFRREVHERIGYDGTVVCAVDPDEVRRAIGELVDRYDIEALAVCLLHSYANPVHERNIQRVIQEAFPLLHTSISSDVCPFMREYERWTTTSINAYTQPIVDRYLHHLEHAFGELGFRGGVYVMASNGGTMTLRTARRFPVRMMESGPAAGILMSAFHGRSLGRPNILSFDMGGTTAKGSLVRHAMPLKTYGLEVARVHAFKKGSGLPVKIPVIDMIEIGSGGGSIAVVDERGVIRVGPESAGADPGPACYRNGGERATLTDANLVLGYLDPAFFLGGAMALNTDASRDVITRDIAEPLGLDLMRAAWGIHEMVNEDVARAFRMHAFERGFDYRACSMVAFGGSAPMHALRIARKVGIPSVVFPLGAGVMAAFGLLISPLLFEVIQSAPMLWKDVSSAILTRTFRPLVKESSALLRRAGVADDAMHIVRRLDMRYSGQGYDIEVELPPVEDDSELIRRIPTLFAEHYRDVFSMSFLDEPIEVVNWKVEARGPAPAMASGYHVARSMRETPLLKGTRRVYLANGSIDCPVYDRYALHPGAVVEGPALVEENESTCVIGVDERASVDDRYNLIATMAR